MIYRLFFKRLSDIAVSVILLVVFSPILLTLSLLLYFKNKGKPFFFQDRPGKGGKIFKVIKFKTMNDLKDEDGNLLPDKDRLTTVGKFVRSTSLDELPQLFNVLVGDMSLVGPRPLLVKYLPLYNNHQAKRHKVRPGITGWAQVNGRNAISWQQRFDYDVYYVENLSFWLDIKIMIMTILKVIRREGISSDKSATMEPFKGNN